MQKEKNGDKDKPHDLENLTVALSREASITIRKSRSPRDPDIVSPGLKEPTGQTTHE